MPNQPRAIGRQTARRLHSDVRQRIRFNDRVDDGRFSVSGPIDGAKGGSDRRPHGAENACKHQSIALRQQKRLEHADGSTDSQAAGSANTGRAARAKHSSHVRSCDDKHAVASVYFDGCRRDGACSARDRTAPASLHHDLAPGRECFDDRPVTRSNGSRGSSDSRSTAPEPAAVSAIRHRVNARTTRQRMQERKRLGLRIREVWRFVIVCLTDGA